MKYLINVTQAHIDEAIRRNKEGNKDVCGNCPIAIAVQEQIKPELRVTLDYIYNPGVPGESYSLPYIGLKITSTLAQNWNQLQPTSFEVEQDF